MTNKLDDKKETPLVRPSTAEMISRLAQEAEVTSRFQGFLTETMQVLLFVIGMSLFLAILGMIDFYKWWTSFGSPRFLLEQLFILVSATLFLGFSFMIATPGVVKPLYKKILIGQIVFMFVYGGAQMVQVVHPLAFGTYKCSIELLMLAVPIELLVYWRMRHAATLQPISLGLTTAMAASLFSLLIVGFACGDKNPLHVFVWHFLPLLVITPVFFWMGRSFLKARSLK